MRLIKPFLLALLLGLGLPGQGLAASIVAAENFYGDIAKQIGGDSASVTSILSNPDQDPHLFDASPSVARDIAKADILIANGMGYDPWFEKLVAAAAKPDSVRIVAGETAQRKDGDNPHLWFDLAAAKAIAEKIGEALAAKDPANAEGYRSRTTAFLAALRAVEVKVEAIASRHKGVAVAATEPVFGYMLSAMGLDVRATDFQTAVMNDTEPPVSAVAAFENDLTRRVIRVLVYNAQASDPLAERMLALAKQEGIAVVAVTETLPPGLSFQAWMDSQVSAVADALDKAN